MDNHTENQPNLEHAATAVANYKVSVRLLEEGSAPVVLNATEFDTLGEVRRLAATALGVELLPSIQDSHDPLRPEGEDTILDPSQTLGEYVNPAGERPKFTLELVRTIKVNALWKVAPLASMTPREILTLFGLKVEEYTLYLPMQQEPLPVDVKIEIHRGMKFEAQKDGKYGDV